MSRYLCSLLCVPEKVDRIEKATEVLRGEFDKFEERLCVQEKETKEVKV